jgi:SAM-dependent methyltransferase
MTTQAPRVQQSRCAICGGETTRTNVGSTGFLRCTGCGYARLLHQGRGDRYWEGRTGAHDFDSVWGATKQHLFSNALGRLEQLSSGRTLCDIGGGAGYFAAIAREHGWAAHVVEISAAARELAAARLGPAFVHESVSGLTEPADVMTMWCVVAHVDDPTALLAEATSGLRPGGWLFLTTPNWHFQRLAGRVLARLGRPINFARQDHVGQFVRRSLRRLLRASGFEDPEFSYCGVTERCCAFGRADQSLIAGKKLWNRTAVAAGNLGLPDLTSELHVFARRAG